MNEPEPSVVTQDGSLSVEATVARDDFQLDIALSVGPGEIVALMGENGFGKTSTLLLVAGLLSAQTGQVRLGEQVWDDPSASIWVPPERRRVGVVFQDYRLFPHLSGLDNVAFGLRRNGMSAAKAREDARRRLAEVGLEGEVIERKPDTYSGGQAQRTALARALAPAPAVLLLDEPFGALDARTGRTIRAYVHDLAATFTGPTILVTHNRADAEDFGDRVVTWPLEDG